MKKSIYSTWHVKLVLVIICAVAIYFAVKAFQMGYNESAENRAKIEGKVPS